MSQSRVKRQRREERDNPAPKYRDGGVGFGLWCEEYVRIPIYPEGSDIPIWTSLGNLPVEYHYIWQEQKKICFEALRMVNKRFIYRLIVLCWMRGEGKSLLACLIQLWKFCNWPRQQIVLGANSKEQTKFVHYDIIRDIILNSPRLIKRIGRRNVQEKEIRIKDNLGRIVSQIKAISSFSGIVSNITGYTFSEIFDMKNPKFFVQLDGSIRNIPNALGVIDSTVSDKTHVLYNLYQTSVKHADPTLFYSYRSSPNASELDYWNPHMVQQQLDSYKLKFPFGEFERYFMNTWEAGARHIFTEEMVRATNYVGADGELGNHDTLLRHIREQVKVERYTKEMMEKAGGKAHEKANFYKNESRVVELEKRLISVETRYTLGGPLAGPEMATVNDLTSLGKEYDTGWVVLGGFDRSDPMGTRPLARPIWTLVAKGLPNSLHNPQMFINPSSVPKFMYFLLDLQVLQMNTLEEMKNIINTAQDEFDGIDMICSERWGMWDLQQWCTDQDIAFEIVHPTYDKQKAAFTELYICYRDGLFKTPVIRIKGTKQDDILKEEAMLFDHDIEKRWFGSREKEEKFGVQDDCIYSLGWTIYGGRELGIDHLRVREAKPYFGTFIESGQRMVGDWS